MGDHKQEDVLKMKQHHPFYEDLLAGMGRYGGSAEGAAEETLGIPAARIRERVVLAPWWEPHMFDPALFGRAEYISPAPNGETMVWDVAPPQGSPFTFIKTHIGAPVCTDVALALGLTPCRECIFVGSVGALDPAMRLGDVVVPECSLCGDGTSRYLMEGPLKGNDPFGTAAYPDEALNGRLIAAAERVCAAENIALHRSRNFSIDTIFAQFTRIGEILALGCNTVEMETAAAFRAAELAGYGMAALFSVSDNALESKSLMGGRPAGERAYRRRVRWAAFPKIIAECFR